MTILFVICVLLLRFKLKVFGVSFILLKGHFNLGKLGAHLDLFCMINKSNSNNEFIPKKMNKIGQVDWRKFRGKTLGKIDGLKLMSTTTTSLTLLMKFFLFLFFFYFTYFDRHFSLILGAHMIKKSFAMKRIGHDIT